MLFAIEIKASLLWIFLGQDNDIQSVLLNFSVYWQSQPCSPCVVSASQLKTSTQPGIANLASKLGHIGANGTNLEIFNISFSTFWLGEQKCTVTDIEKPIWCQSDSFVCQI